MTEPNNVDQNTLGNRTFLRLSTGHPAQLVIGLTVWCVWFVAVYGGLSVACELAAPDPAQGAFNAINITLILITILTILGLIWGAWACWKSTASRSHLTDPSGRQAWFIARISASLYTLSAVAALIVMGPLLALPPCL